MFTDMHAWKKAQIAAARKQALPILSFPCVSLLGVSVKELVTSAELQARKLITDRPVFAGVIGPFSLAARLMGVSDIMMACYDEPEAVALVLEKATRFLVDYIKAYQEAGAHGVIIAEPVAGLLSPALAAEFSAPYITDIRKQAASSRFLVIYHNCGNNVPLMMPAITATGCDGYHFGDAVDLAPLADQVPADCLLLGNISPAEQFLNGSPDSMRAATLGLLGELAPRHQNFIISSGCDIPPGSPWANIDAFFAAAAAYYQPA